MARGRKLSLKIPEHLAGGAYANQLIVRHTREEFLLDFVNRFPPQVAVVSRVILHPGHMRRMIRALEDNLERYEAVRGAVEIGPEPPARPAPEASRPDTVSVPERIAGGAYANQLVVSHSGDEFLLDFANVFPPDSIVTSRVFVSPRLFKRMIEALKDNLSRYESAMRAPIQTTLPPSTDPFLN